jgi:hypothetical protein
VKTPAPLSRGLGGRARGSSAFALLGPNGETFGSPAPHETRRGAEGSPFSLTRFPTSESHPATAGRTLRTRLGWVATEVDLR